jgi:hypothetical protein
MTKRRRFQQTQTLDQRLANEAARLRDAANRTPPGPDRDHLMRQARHTETAAHMNDWLTLPGLQPSRR